MFEYQVKEFWDKFENHVKMTSVDIYEPDFLSYIDKTIGTWDLTWEIGPGTTREFSLTISPNGNPVKVQQCESIIGLAPNLVNWEYFRFKQPKENWNLLNMPEYGLEIDATDWTHVLSQFPEGDFNLLLKADNIRSFEKQIQEIITDLILTNLLGEEIKMNEISSFEIVDKFDSENGISRLWTLPMQLARDRNGR